MKGIILAGGTGSRLSPVTRVTNKHLLPVYDKPMISYPLELLVESGVDKIMLITHHDFVGQFVKMLGSGEELRKKYGRPIQIVYAVQSEATGIADGLWIAKDYVGRENCALILGDNVFENADELKEEIRNFKDGATIFLKPVPDPERFGIAEVAPDGTVLSIEEKPKKPRSDLAVTGLYLYDATCFDKCVGQPKSDRGEFEITYINELYRKEGKLRSRTVSGEWFDAGTFDSLLEVANFMKNR